MPLGITTSSASPSPSTAATPTNQRLTAHAAASIAIAASGGALFGWDLGVTGGVSTSDSFLEKFFPDILARKRSAKAKEESSSGGGSGGGSGSGGSAAAAAADPYCVYDSQALTLFTSSAFLAAALTTLLVAGAVTRRRGRRFSMAAAGGLFVVGIGLCAGAVDLGMLIAGRLMIGVAIGLCNQAVPLFLSEIAPSASRGAVNAVFQLLTTLTILLSQVANFVLLPRGGQAWRASVGLALAPALVLLGGSLFYLKDTPASLASRGLLAEARRELERLRGFPGAGKNDDDKNEDEDDEGREWETIRCAAAAAAAAAASNNDVSSPPSPTTTSPSSPPLRTTSLAASVREDLASLSALFRRTALPSTVAGVGVAFFSQVNGINAILFYAAPFFDAVIGSAGSSSSSGLLSAVVVGLALFGFTLVALCLVDRVGRRKLLFVGGSVMLASELALSGLLGHYLGHSPASSSSAAKKKKLLPRAPAAGALFLMCSFVAAFASSLGPLGWLIPTEVFPSATRSAGQALSTAVNFLFVFVTTQFFLPSLCAMRHWTFLAAAVAVAALLAFVALLLPETRGVNIEKVQGLFRKHWFWKRFFPGSSGGGEEEEEGRRREAL